MTDEELKPTVETLPKPPRKVQAPRTPNFLPWLKAYLKKYGQTDQIADLALDASCDKCFPKSGKEFKTYLEHLKKHNACRPAIISLKMAFERYRSENRLPEVNYDSFPEFI